MAITKPPVLPSWAEAGDKVQPSNAEIQAGWPLSSVPPSRQRFNWILNFVSNAVRYLLQRGLPEWSASEDYPIGARIQYGGLNYVSLTANTDKQPDTNTSDWEQWGYGDTAFQGRVDQLASFSVTTADVALTAAQAKAGILNVSGTLTGNRNIIIPNSSRRFVIINGTSGAYSLGVKTASGSAVTVAQGAATSVVCDGANNVKLASTDLSSYAPLASPALTGTPTAPTAAVGTNTTQVATTAYVNAEIAADRPYEATAANIKMNGTQAVGTLATVARGDHAHPTDTSRAPLASPALTGTPTAPTAAVGTNTTQIATTAFAKAEAASAAAAVALSFASSAENAAGTVEGKAVDPLGIREALNATGSAPVYACRAWVNFNGTGTVAIRASGNVSSITDNGTGDYTVNFTTAMPDANYCATVTCSNSATAPSYNHVGSAHTLATSSARIQTNQAASTLADQAIVSVAIFR